MEYSDKIDEDIEKSDIDNKKEEKTSVSLKKDTIELLDEVARKKICLAMKSGTFDVINLIRSKRGSGVSYDSQINFLARIYLALIEETHLTKNIVNNNPELKKVLDRLNEINNFFFKNHNEKDE